MLNKLVNYYPSVDEAYLTLDIIVEKTLASWVPPILPEIIEELPVVEEESKDEESKEIVNIVVEQQFSEPIKVISEVNL